MPEKDDGREAIDLDHIEIMAAELKAERKRILDPAGDHHWSHLAAWANRGERYMEIVRAQPPERHYRALVAEVKALRRKVEEMSHEPV